MLDSTGRLLSNPIHYRDSRTDGVMEQVLERVAADLYEVTGLQQLPFNTIYQLAAEGLLGQADKLLMIPDLLAYWLTGKPWASERMPRPHSCSTCGRGRGVRRRLSASVYR